MIIHIYVNIDFTNTLTVMHFETDTQNVTPSKNKKFVEIKLVL